MTALSRAAGLLIAGSGMLTIVPASAAESWLCSQMIRKLSVVTKYQVNGDILVINDGRGHADILENNSDRMISYLAFLSDTYRYPKNIAPVEIAEPHYIYMILKKHNGRLTELDATTAEVISDQYGKLAPPQLSTQQCVLGPSK